MADLKITGLTADTSPTSDDLIPTVNDPAGTPANRKVTLANAITKAHGLSDGAVVSVASSTLVTNQVTSSAAELNILDGATLTVTELNYVDGVTSAIQTQLDAKQAADADLTTLATAFSSASASGPASLAFHEDIDNGTNKITVVGVASVASDKTLTLPDATDTLVGKATTDTLTNKSIDLASNTITATKAQLDTAVSDGNIMFDGDSIVNATATAHRVFYSDGSGVITELALGADGTFLKSNGATSAPTFATPSGSGDVSKVGTPVNNQVGVWTGDGTLEGDADLTFDGALLSTDALAITGTSGAGYITLIAQDANPAAPTAGTALLHSATTQGFTRVELDNEATTNTILGRDNVFIAKNTSGGTINKGEVVYVTGSTGNVPNIAKAQANALATLPAVGVLVDNILNNAFGNVMTLGIIASLDTSAFSVGAPVYVSAATAGLFTATRPSGTTNFVQRVGTVLVSGAGNGSLLVGVTPAILNMETGTNSATFAATAVTVIDDAYAAGWNGSTAVPTKNAVYDKIETLQPLDAELTAIAGLTSAADKGIQFTGSGTAGVFDLTTAGKALLDDASATAQVATLGLTNTKTRQIEFIIGDGTNVITTGEKKSARVSVPVSGTITDWIILSLDDTSGSIGLDIWKDTYANYPPTVADTITASAKPSVTTATKNASSTLTGWATSISAGDILSVNVDSITSLKVIKLIVKYTVT